MKSILVATDFSQGAETAVKYAKHLAKISEQKLIYLHIINLPIVDPSFTSNIVAETIDELKKEAEIKLRGIVDSDRTQGVNAEFRTSFEDIINLINVTAEQEDVSMVVVGKTGQRTILDKMLGSTAQSLIGQISEPLLIIPESYSGDILHKLCFATNFENQEILFIKRSLIWQSFSENQLFVTHIIDKDGVEDFEADKVFVDNLNRELSSGAYSFKYYSADDYKSGIKEFIENENISLLFVNTHKRGFLEGIFDPSKTKDVIHSIDVPVMVYSHQK